MDVTQLALTWVGWPNSVQFDLDQSERKSSQVNVSAPKPWPNEVSSWPAQVFNLRQLASTCVSVWQGLKSWDARGPMIWDKSSIFRTNRPRSIYQYSDMAPRLSGQTSIFGVVFFVSKSLLGIERPKKLEKFAILTRKPRSHAWILIYRTWPIGPSWRHIFVLLHARVVGSRVDVVRHDQKWRELRVFTAMAGNKAGKKNHRSSMHFYVPS